MMMKTMNLFILLLLKTNQLKGKRLMIPMKIKNKMNASTLTKNNLWKNNVIEISKNQNRIVIRLKILGLITLEDNNSMKSGTEILFMVMPTITIIEISIRKFM